MMESSLDWLVFRPEDIVEAKRYLDQLDQSEATVDALGFGRVLEVVSEILFPATSTLHRRIRYQIFVPAIIYSLTRRRTPFNPKDVLRGAQAKLVQALVKHEKRDVIGRIEREGIKYPPDVLYWSALNKLKLLGRKAVSRDEVLDHLERRFAKGPLNDDGERAWDAEGEEILDFDRDFEQIAQNLFKDMKRTAWVDEGLRFALSPMEARYLKGKYDAFPNSLTHWLLRRPAKIFADARDPFSLPATGLVALDCLILEGKRFSSLAMGATYAYRWAICKHKHSRSKGERRWRDGLELNRDQFHGWRTRSRLGQWRYAALVEAARAFGADLGDPKLDAFLQNLREMANSGVSTDQVLGALAGPIQAREERVKGSQSRFGPRGITIPKNTFESSKQEDFLFDYRWTQGRSNAVDIVKGLRGA